MDFVHKNLNVFPFKSFPFISSLHIFNSHPAFVSQSFLAQINQIADQCNYNSYLKKYLTYPPPPAPFALPGISIETDPGCDVHTEIIKAALLLNPAFNIYRIFDMVYYLLLVYLPLQFSHFFSPPCSGTFSAFRESFTGQHELYPRSNVVPHKVAHFLKYR